MDAKSEQLLKRYLATEDPKYAIQYTNHILRTVKLPEGDYLEAPIGFDQLFELLSLNSRTETGEIFFETKIKIEIDFILIALHNNESTGVAFISRNWLEQLGSFNVENISIDGCEDRNLYLTIEFGLITNIAMLEDARNQVRNYIQNASVVSERLQTEARQWNEFFDVWEGIVLPLLEDR